MTKNYETLFVIPARGGSKGLPKKNILPLGGIPIIGYTINAARGVVDDENICVSTDDLEIIKVVEDFGLEVPFIRPAELASDTANSRDVLLHALDFYSSKFRRKYSKVCLLQPTSPLRSTNHIQEAFQYWENGLDMVVSVKKARANPYYNLFEENEKGYLKLSKQLIINRRQDAPKVWEYNGAIYIISIGSLRQKPLNKFEFIRKYVMEEAFSIDIDSLFDFTCAKAVLLEGLNNY
jgi:CMP-N-acetylneuraminic acid synthetase